MISDKVRIADKENTCEGLAPALEMVEKTAAFTGYGPRESRQLSALAEEMVSGSAAMLDVFSGTMWVETDDDTFAIKLEMEGTFTQEERERLIQLTRDNKNTLPKGFFAKLGVLLGDAFSGEYFYPYGVMGEPGETELIWQSAEIAEMMRNLQEPDAEDKAIGEEAKQVLDMFADDIIVSARADYVLITVTKALPKA